MLTNLLRAVLEARYRSLDLSRLPYADGAAYNHKIWQYEDRCLMNTRVELRQHVLAWSRDVTGPCVFWLNGMAGTGKFTISRTVASDLAKEGRLGASFFFSKGRKDINHAGKFFTTVAAQLANSLPALRPLILEAIDDQFDLFHQGLSEQWKHLIFQPLSVLKYTAPQGIPLVVVIDALDECAGQEGIRTILRLFLEFQKLTTIRVHVLVTSRPDTPIQVGFRNMPGGSHQSFVLHGIPLPVVSKDISVFFQHKLAVVKAECGLSTPWPSDQKIEQLVARAAGLFIYAATI